MKFYDFMCKTEGCQGKEKRISRAYPSQSDREKYPPVCDCCKKVMEEVDGILPKHNYQGGLLIKGSPRLSGMSGFAKGLTSKNPEDLKRDLEKGDLFH